MQRSGERERPPAAAVPDDRPADGPAGRPSGADDLPPLEREAAAVKGGVVGPCGRPR